MSEALGRLAPFDDEGNLRVVVETPRGATVKIDYDAAHAVFAVARALPLGVAYPYDWGFIPGTRGEDGDPLDALVLHEASTYPGVVLSCRALGMVALTQRGRGRARERNNRIIALPTFNDRLGDVQDHTRLPPRMREEVEQFFATATFFTGKDVKLEGWRSAKAAEAFIRTSRG